MPHVVISCRERVQCAAKKRPVLPVGPRPGLRLVVAAGIWLVFNIDFRGGSGRRQLGGGSLPGEGEIQCVVLSWPKARYLVVLPIKQPFCNLVFRFGRGTSTRNGLIIGLRSWFWCALHYFSSLSHWNGSRGQVWPETGPKRPKTQIIYLYPNKCR